MRVFQVLLMALMLWVDPSHAVTCDFTATSTVSFSGNPGLINRPMGIGNPVTGSLTLQDTPGGRVATLDLLSGIAGGFEPVNPFAVTPASGATPDGFFSTSPSL